MTDTESEAFTSVKKFADRGATKWNDAYFGSGRRDKGTTLSRSGATPLDERELNDLWRKRANKDCHARGVLGIVSWIEERVSQRFNDEAGDHRCGVDIDDMCQRALEIGIAMWGPPGADWVPDLTYKDKDTGEQRDTDIVKITMKNVIRELPHVMASARDYVGGTHEEGENGEKVVKPGHKSFDPAILELLAVDPLGNGLQDRFDMEELIKHYAPKVGDRDDAAEVLYNALFNGKDYEDIAETLGVGVRTLSRAVSKWYEKVQEVREVRKVRRNK
jgi:hypothetical protein